MLRFSKRSQQTLETYSRMLQDTGKIITGRGKIIFPKIVSTFLNRR